MTPEEYDNLYAKRILAVVAREAGQDLESVRHTVTAFTRVLHRHALEYEGINGDVIGEDLPRQLGDEAFFHLLGFLEWFAERYEWERGIANEYLLRHPPDDRWRPFGRQMEMWEREKERE